MPEPSERLKRLLADEADRLDLVMATIASVAPDPPTEEDVAARFDVLAEGVDSSPSVADVLGYVYGELGFVGAGTDYYSPSNSFIHRVLERRRGIPLSLAAVTVEIGRRVGVRLAIVGMPGHVLLSEGTADSTAGQWFDPFGGGAPLDVEDCRRLFARFNPIESFEPAMLAPIPNVASAFRMLTNLKVAYRRLGDAGQLVKVLELIVSVPGAPASERYELATALAMLGRDDQAADQYELLATLDGERAARHRQSAFRHRARRN